MVQTMKAVVVQPGNVVKVEEKPVPDNLGPKEVLFKVVAVGQNPTDWKHVAWRSKPGAISGCDFVGIATRLGSDVPKDIAGQLRAGFVRGGVSQENGAFAEYVKQEWDVTWRVPQNITPQQAASGPIPIVTTAQALYLIMGLPLPTGEPEESLKNKWILVWSGSTAVGQYAIQFAKLAGLKIATTASPKKHELVKSLGADIVFDYRDPDVARKLKEATSDGIVYGLDTISEKGSTEIVQAAFSTNGGQLVLLLPQDISKLPRPDVKTKATLGYTANGQDHSFGPVTFKSTPEDRQNYVETCKLIPKLFEEGKIRPLEVTDLGGLDTVQQGLDSVRNGTNLTKLVHTISSI